MPLLARLVLLILIAVLPALAILLYNEYDVRQARVVQARQEALDKAQDVADQLDTAIEGARDLLGTVAAAPPVRNQDWAGCAMFIAALADANGRFSQILVTDHAGYVRCASASVAPESTITDRPHFQAVLAGAEFALGDFLVGRFTDVPIVPIAVPVRDDAGRVRSVVSAGLRLDWLNRRIDRDQLPPSTLVTVIDRGGVILARHPNPERWVGQNAVGHVRAHLDAAGPSTAEGRDLEGVHRTFAHVPPRATTAGLLVAVAISADYALGPIERATERGLALVAFAGLLALLAAWLVGERFILRPIRELVAVAHALREGRYRGAAPPAGSAEFDALNDALRGSAEALAAREADLRASQATLRSFHESAPVLMGVVELVGEDILHVYDNPATCRFLGAEPGGTEGRLASALGAPPDAIREWVARYREAAAHGAPVRFEYRHAAGPDGAFWLMVTVAVIGPGPTGRTRFSYVGEDITERRRAEEALRESGERLRAALAASHTGTYRWDMRTGAAQGDDAQTALFGGPIRSDKEFVARIHLDDRSTVIAMLDRCLEEGVDFVLDYRILLPDGSVRWLSDRGRAFRDADGKPLYMTGAVVDITERKCAEAALREHEELLSLATAGANLIAFRWNVRTGAVRLSGRVEALTGLPPGTTASSYRGKLKSVHPDDRARFEAAIARALQDGVYEAEYRHVRADRAVVWLYDKGLVHRDDAGRPVELIGVSMDVTARKAAEERQALLAAELDHRAKNMLTLVLALVRTTRAASVPEFVKAVQGRIRALARAHALLSESRWAGADLRRLAEEELAPFRTREESRVRMSGPAVTLAPKAAQALAMALHELATNAVKYGALSAPAGRVEVAWTVERRRLVLRWVETGGPPASPPTRRGTGTAVIEKSITYQLDGAVEFVWGGEGLACEMVVAIEKVARASMHDMAR